MNKRLRILIADDNVVLCEIPKYLCGIMLLLQTVSRIMNIFLEVCERKEKEADGSI